MIWVLAIGILWFLVWVDQGLTGLVKVGFVIAWVKLAFGLCGIVSDCMAH